ncbi:hypothetical protein CHISP_0076 [Chitinispirillum alkaliphilum]|nr:hypothetical protein CHISP_0076 [Chitinispirillum alkaliphilum]
MKKPSVMIFLIFLMYISAYPFHTTLQFRESSSTFRSIFFTGSDTGYAAGTPSWDYEQKRYTGSILKSVDGGRSWSKLSAGSDAAFSDVHFVSRTTGFVVGSQGTVAITRNMGGSWTIVRLDTGYDLMSVFFSDPNSGWISGRRRSAGSGNAVKVWRTTDGGNTWRETSFPADAQDIQDLQFVSSSRGWAVGSRRASGGIRGAVYTTTDGGSSWTHQFSPGFDITFSSASFTDANSGWVVGSKSSSSPGSANTIFRTTNGGTTWEAQSINSDLNSVKFIDSQRGYTAGPRIRGGQPTVFRTMDGGRNWTRFLVNRQTGEAVLDIHLTSGRIVLAGERGFISMSNNPWRTDVSENDMIFSSYQIGDRFRFDAVHFIDERHGWIGGTRADFEHGNQVIYYTSDGGESWRNIFERDTFCAGYGRLFSRVRDIHVFSDRSAIAAAGLGSHFCDPQSSYLLFSDDAVNNWQAQVNYRQAQLFALHAIDRRNIWFLPQLSSGDPLRLLYTSDMGRTFTMRTFTPTVPAINHGDIFFYDSRNGWVVGGDGFAAYTSDGGTSWQRTGQGVVRGRLRAVHFLSLTRGWIGGENLYETHDGGNTWQIRNIDFPGDIYDIEFTSPNNGWVVGDNGIIKHTRDGGLNWTNELPPRSNYVQLGSISMVNDTVGWAVGGAGVILKVESGGSSSIRAHANQRSSANITSIFTHNNSIQLSFDISRTTEVSLQLVTLSGRVVYAENKNITPENRMINISTRNISSGMYILNYTADGVSVNRRLLIR